VLTKRIGRFMRAKLVLMAMCLGLVGSLGVMNSQSASAEPFGYYQQCSMNGWVFSVNSPRQCYDGLVTVRSLRDNSVLYRLDMWKARYHIPQYATYAQSQAACARSIICTGASVFLISKFKYPIQVAWAMFGI